jgi:hypothetical protein
MADPNPLAGMPLAESLANNLNESLQWMSRLWSSSAAGSLASIESLRGAQSSVPPALPSMLMPTLDPNELDKRITDLRTVEHWLDMNRALLHSTIQTLEMQRNAIVALQSMGRGAQPGSGPSGTGGVDPNLPPGETSMGAQPLPFNPAQWWNALQEQFARVASTAASETQRASDAPPPEPAASPDRNSSGP